MFDGVLPRIPVEDLGTIAAGIDHGEGICVTPDGTLHVSGEKGQVYRIAEDGCATEIGSTGGWTLGLAADGSGPDRRVRSGATRGPPPRPGDERLGGPVGRATGRAVRDAELGGIWAGRQLLRLRFRGLEGT